jgi:hypothetical protein
MIAASLQRALQRSTICLLSESFVIRRYTIPGSNESAVKGTLAGNSIGSPKDFACAINARNESHRFSLH